VDFGGREWHTGHLVIYDGAGRLRQYCSLRMMQVVRCGRNPLGAWSCEREG